MLFAAIAALIGSAACAYLIGYTFAAPRDAFVRTKRGMLLVIVVGLSVIPLPPQLPSLAGAVGSLGGAAASLGGLAWPESLSKSIKPSSMVAPTAKVFSASSTSGWPD